MAGVAAAPRVLLVAHDFPPGVGSGSLRALAFARYLPMYGWRPVVLTVADEWAMNRDDALLSSVPRGLEVVRTHSFEARSAVAAAGGAPSTVQAPGAVRRQLGHLKRFPDAHVGWLPHAVARARRFSYDVIYSTSGPFTSHVVGLALHASTRKPWVAELRDGWFEWNRAIFPDYPRWRGVLEQRLEGVVIRGAQRVVLVTTRMRDAFRAQYPELPAEHFSEVPNGFDPVQLGAAGTPASMEGFEVVHAGALYYGRSLAAFLAAARRLCAEDAAFAQAFRLTLFGTFDGAA
ncbi:MAG TPA: glycosyltransferase, partial [Chloroflexota bacterium]|nr:glycosyltransferase [Chloroflexota bacterium]